MTYKTLQTNFERELLFQIIQNLRHKKLTHEEAKIVAQRFMPVLKSETAQEFIESLAKLAQYHPEILEAFIKTIREYEKDEVANTLSRARVCLSEFATNDQLRINN